MAQRRLDLMGHGAPQDFCRSRNTGPKGHINIRSLHSGSRPIREVPEIMVCRILISMRSCGAPRHTLGMEVHERPHISRTGLEGHIYDVLKCLGIVTNITRLEISKTACVSCTSTMPQLK